MDNFIEKQRVVTVQANQKLDILQESISKLTNKFVHQEEENLEEESQEDECLTETILVE